MSLSSTPKNNNTEHVKIFMLDNLDSFTYNLVDEFQCLGFEPTIYRNTISADYILEQIQACETPVLLVLSPGPGEPSKAGCLMQLIEKTAGKYPILGICLGHQALIEYYGGIVGRAPEIIHGKASNVQHDGNNAFNNIQQPLPVARYHSLVATKMPNSLTMTAQFTTSDGVVLPMAIEHNTDRVIGFQFHPESILTTYGSNLLAQAIECLTSNSAQTSQLPENIQQQTGSSYE
ncbi:aminodeoxychorismate/anthranilate synthase component II [Colwellia sp. 1_MG-2023]|uniref:aminodeoxychorismate/anthranilate synthase component II n=1 Tax=Colwellia sp. 1_MG-2023 TaxID=3062649 RepID=UPI0026E3034E|nr:aminodeoxychorismate/anthranilate synthase component II [Colwellia sp. 1_MG-2023]MDO6445956.1 aminodeoxychorismate/anthranilate synthase component II [Colwellia sp. 1_MG-2023]